MLFCLPWYHPGGFVELGEGQPSLSVLLYTRFCCLRASPPAVTAPNFWAALPGVLLGQVGTPGRRSGCTHPWLQVKTQPKSRAAF